MRTTLLLMISFLMFVPLSAQDYITGLGARLGYAKGVSVKHFVTSNHAVEAIFSTRYRGFMTTALYQIHAPVASLPNTHWYYGAGLHAGFWNGYNTEAPWFDGRENYGVYGLDAMLGVEYRFGKFPIVASADWKPALSFIGRKGYWDGDAAISLRYVFD